MRLLTTYWPARNLANSDFFSDMERVFDGLAQAQPTQNTAAIFRPSYDSQESEDHYLLTVDLPGVKKEDLKIELNAKILTVSGERKGPRNTGTFSRSFTLPETVNADKIEAQHENGVLNLYLPKTVLAKPRTIEIQSQKGGFFEKLLNTKADKEESTTSSH